MAARKLPPNLLEHSFGAGLCFWGMWSVGPLVEASEPQYLSMALAAGGICLAKEPLCHGILNVARLLDWWSSHQPTGQHGTARWGKLKDIKKQLLRQHSGPYWGVPIDKRRKPLFVDYASNAMTLGPAGVGKGVKVVIPMGLAIPHAKVFSDFKGELTCVLKPALEERGERVVTLNPGGLWTNQLGASDSYNPLDVIVGDLYRSGGLRDVPDDLRELANQIQPEPSEEGSDDSYWRQGGRSVQSIITLIEAMIEGREATLSSVAHHLEDRKKFEHHLRWILGIDIEGKPLPEGPMPIEQAEWAERHNPKDLEEFITWLRGGASYWLNLITASYGNTANSFISGAQQALAPFAFGRLAPAMRQSTFSMDDLKNTEQITNLFIIADASRMEVYKPYIGLMQWCAMTAIKRHPNKKAPVYFIQDEATNYKINGLEGLLTWGRSYGIRLHLIFQDLAAFEKTYGRNAFRTLLSECEIKQFLPGQSSPDTLQLISDMLGEAGIKEVNLSKQDLEDGLHEQTSEAARPLLKPEEIRCMEQGLLFIRKKPALLIDLPTYGEIHPWRDQAAINPFHGEPFMEPVSLRLKEAA